jgi:hypothetical protein
MKKFIISLIGTNPWHSPCFDLMSDIPYSNEFNWSSKSVNEFIGQLNNVLNGEQLYLEWNTDKINGVSYKERSELIPNGLKPYKKT